MIDRYTKMILTVIAVALTALVLQQQFTVRAQAPQPVQHCVWTYISDAGRPNLGKNGSVDLADPDWKRASEEGWQLKVAGHNDVYVFERCQ